MIPWLITCAALIFAALQFLQRRALQAQLHQTPEPQPLALAEAPAAPDVTSAVLAGELHTALNDLHAIGKSYDAALTNAVSLLPAGDDFKGAMTQLNFSALGALPLRLRFGTAEEHHAARTDLGLLLQDDPERYADPAAAAQAYLRHLMGFSVMLVAEPQYHQERVVEQMIDAARRSTRTAHATSQPETAPVPAAEPPLISHDYT